MKTPDAASRTSNPVRVVAQQVLASRMPIRGRVAPTPGSAMRRRSRCGIHARPALDVDHVIWRRGPSGRGRSSETAVASIIERHRRPAGRARALRTALSSCPVLGFSEMNGQASISFFAGGAELREGEDPHGCGRITRPAVTSVQIRMQRRLHVRSQVPAANNGIRRKYAPRA